MYTLTGIWPLLGLRAWEKHILPWLAVAASAASKTALNKGDSFRGQGLETIKLEAGPAIRFCNRPFVRALYAENRLELFRDQGDFLRLKG